MLALLLAALLWSDAAVITPAGETVALGQTIRCTNNDPSETMGVEFTLGDEVIYTQTVTPGEVGSWTVPNNNALVGATVGVRVNGNLWRSFTIAFPPL